jgi:hypothetical protein
MVEHLEGLGDVLPTLAQAVGGGPGASVAVTVGGHANPGHTPREGWSDDFITVTVALTGAPITGSSGRGE